MRRASCLPLLWSLALPAWAVDGFVLSLGKVTRPSGSGDVRVGVDWILPWRWADNDTGVLESRFELGAGYSDTARDSVWSVTAEPLLHYQFKGARTGWGPFVEVGVGPSWVSDKCWGSGHDLNSRWHFASRLSAGYAFGAHEVSVDFRHFSNAGLTQPNPGANLVTMRYRWAL
ncbi:acyloxyacyl hydrolase [Crenobacter cavernae]|uniref:Acyloxyacyl hydrolase n=1 Tax=Crenobacter cavernae TaxID=2290923 RepID=A0A345Y4I9_9NEIS|nr:acyloxyacyl hydrolase [Crenobacter cavernae]AXK38841.1 acyloxyacyl hydrolase [Crenobacter cavernae]